MKRNTPCTSLPDSTRPTLSEQVVALQQAGEHEAAAAVVARATRQHAQAGDELYAARLIVEDGRVRREVGR